ncbi:rRNA-processing endoribonuclease [Starmerella bacillaris]|uniref:rRNA-processing endoribonuclease n=1 Tax=Starmerella bacillaris TaxID=1247836 RepID=A0AAV5RJD8_STABA|nr:rRNA-processing endoribonuclease [Starmerella bacillaris]
MITFEGSDNFVWRLVLATLSGKPIKITKIRPEEKNPGLVDYEVTFLRVLDSITNGSVLEISYTGTTVIYKPGLIIGGVYKFTCPLSKPVGYFIEPLLALLPFAKLKSELTFEGITSALFDTDASATAKSQHEMSVDFIRTSIFPVLAKFGIPEVELQINKRGSAPQGGGEAVLRVNTLLLAPKTLHATEQISVNKIRGVAYSTRVAPTSVNRMIDICREELKPLGVDTFIYSDVAKGPESGLSPGFGVCLVAETKKQMPVSVEATATSGSVPEELGKEAAHKLINEISQRGAVGGRTLPLVIVFMLLGSEDIGRLLVNKRQISPVMVQLLKDIAAVYPGQHAAFKPEDENGNMMMLMKGSGFVNANKKIS